MNKSKQECCEKNCPDYNGMSILHLEQCDCSCHPVLATGELESSESIGDWKKDCSPECEDGWHTHYPPESNGTCCGGIVWGDVKTAFIFTLLSIALISINVYLLTL